MTDVENGTSAVGSAGSAGISTPGTRAVGSAGSAGTSVVDSGASADPLALDRQVCFALAVASRSVIAMYRPVLEPLGLTHPQYLVMLALWERSPRSAGDIADALLLEPATLSPLLKRLETAGLLERRRSVRDERALSIELTAAGRALRGKAEKVPAQVIDLLGMPVEELESIRDALSGLIGAATTARARG